MPVSARRLLSRARRRSRTRACPAPRCSSRRTIPASIPTAPADAVLSIDALCFNRDLPTDLPFGGGHPRLRLVEGAAAVAAPRTAVTAATPTLRPPLREGGFWRLVSHLSLGHLSVIGGDEGAAALKEVLRLYDLRDTAETRAAIEALIGRYRRLPGTARAPAPRRRLLPRARRDAGVRSAAPGRPAGSICWPRCWSASWRCTPRSTASSAPARRCAAAPGSAAAWPARSGTRVLRMRARSRTGRLRAEPRRFRFDAAVRVLTRARQDAGSGGGGAVPLAGRPGLSAGRRARGPPAGDACRR